MKPYNERLADAKAMYAMPVKKETPEQKYKTGCQIFCKDKMWGNTEYNGDKGFFGIVQYTYGQKYHGDNYKEYSLVVLDGNKPVNRVSWFDELFLTLIDNNIDKGLGIIKSYESTR